MPYHLSTEIADCSGVAVVKTATGEVMGCHDSQEEANAQLAALHIAEADRGANEEITLREQVTDMEIREEGNAMYPLNERQTMQYGLLEALVESFGKFDQSSGANGAHYMAEQPFMAEGMQCSNCVFYEGPRGCELVHGDIDPSAICKLWVIPESLIAGIVPSDPAEMVIEEPTDMPIPEVLAQRESVMPVYWRMLQLRDTSNTITLPLPEITGTYSAVDVEERLVQGRTFEVRATPTSISSASVDPSLPLTFRGYAAVFNSASQPLPFIETIRPGAFKRSLQSGKEIRMYLNHNSDQVLASTRSGTLRLTEDTRGLMVEADLPPTSYGKDISILMQRGDVHSMSFGFTIPTAGDSWSSDGRSRELREIILHEVSIVTGFPAYEGTAGATITD